MFSLTCIKKITRKSQTFQSFCTCWGLTKNQQLCVCVCVYCCVLVRSFPGNQHTWGSVQGCVGSDVQRIQASSENQLAETLLFLTYLRHEPVDFSPTPPPSSIHPLHPPASIRLCTCEYEASEQPHEERKACDGLLTRCRRFFYYQSLPGTHSSLCTFSASTRVWEQTRRALTTFISR